VGSVAVYEVRGSENISDPPAHLTDTALRPNIILITIDAASADHFSCYGYSRETTPNLDRLAKRGVQFENAIAPSSWTLPSFASMFTGLFPHQHGADGASPLPKRFPTLAMALKSAGYQTVGFNANLSYGQASEGMAQGFDLYEDGSENLRQNLMRTLFGSAFVRFVSARFAQPDRPERQSAEEINRKVLRWFPRRTRRPYFLFINYFDVHSPYFAPRPFAKRFGELPDAIVRRMNSGIIGTRFPAITPMEQASLVAGYDNSLAYADSQIEALMQFLAKSPDWSNTVVIITSDHGESFGEHGFFGHGWNLSRELVHVPLIILGPGIPAGLRVRSVVATRKLYATILGLAEGSTTASPSPSSLQNYWSGKRDSAPEASAVVSEVDVPTPYPRLQNAYISVTTPQWHWILDAHGHTQLFDWVKDPTEKADLAASPEASAVVENLQRDLRKHVMTSPRPWAGLSYLQPIGLGRFPPVNPPDRDMLDSLPYQ
jgi:arylsulfatase A-like enzyme